MQGFIVNLNRVKEEDLIVTIVSRQNLDTLYRFYGARHSVINLGYKIDYEKEYSSKSSIARLKDVIHIGYPWINDMQRLKLWQDFTALFYKHLKEIEDLHSFYFDLLEEASLFWNKKNPKRVAIESYVKLLEFEGRLHKELVCFLCSQHIQTQVSLIRAYLPTHYECSNRLGISQKAFYELCENNSTLFMDDKEVDILWYTLLEGL